MSVVDLDEFRPHINIHTADNNVHVMPVSLIKDIAEGKRKTSGIPEMDPVIAEIVRQWAEDRGIR